MFSTISEIPVEKYSVSKIVLTFHCSSDLINSGLQPPIAKVYS